MTDPAETNGTETSRVADLMGKRRTDVVYLDLPVELGYWCPVCRVEPRPENSEWDERLTWSEYNGFLWCYVCERDYPSVLCVQLDGKRLYDHDQVGIDAAIEVFLDTVVDATQRAVDNDQPVDTQQG